MAEQVLEQLRKAPLIERTALSVGRAFFCWDDDRKLKYFPVVVKQPPERRARLIKVACLRPDADAAGIYTVDPSFHGETGNRKRDYAHESTV